MKGCSPASNKDTQRDKEAFRKLKEDLDSREQLRPGVALQDGGVLDGNRRLAALRRLWKDTKSDRYAYFEAVILPTETTDEERWKIEAGLQLGLNERHDYSPVNELIKVRQGLEMYRAKIRNQELPAVKSEFELVAGAIYGKTEADVREMARRLDLIDGYLTFIGKTDRYDLVGESSEDFKEALRVVTAAENQGTRARTNCQAPRGAFLPYPLGADGQLAAARDLPFPRGGPQQARSQAPGE